MTATIGHNQPPADEAVFTEITDLFDEAKNWADGEPIDSDEMHDAITKLKDGLHEAGKRAEELRVAEKAPIIKAGKDVDAKFKPYSTKVEQGKKALSDLLAAWRKKKADELAAEAKRKADLAAAEMEAAQAAIRETSGNLTARVDAEEQLSYAKDLEKNAKRAGKAATTGLGLRTIWHADITDAAAALDWAFEQDAAAFTDMATEMAQRAVRGGKRDIPGFRIWDEQVAR
ncbi:hypothetical protein E2A64_10190 [Pseudohoeflea suaedae]|uniref:Uncharacterized protein n=1 Tax=Pseudohoeflea suaedae TaxID=877384 RepID=A0A4R5PJ76_9HYPH|nr:hypothetical protein [Pseudohoeflea suaedae]TDH35700.1 hypothetical protein E2A64_10190 [Pseudohoeflea suaedae]